jgi:hypothetical protein
MSQERTIAAGFHEQSREAPLMRWLRSLAGRFIERSQPGDRSLFIEGRLTFGPKKQLLLVSCHGKRFLMASSADSVTSLVEVPHKGQGTVEVKLRGYCQ